MFAFAGGESLVTVLYSGEDLYTNASFDKYFEDRCYKTILELV